MSQGGVEARQQAALEMDIKADTSPLLGGLLQSFPSLRRSIKRNPALANMAMEILGKRFGGAAGAGSTGTNGGSKPKFNL
jgi:hypothetical protein